MSTHAMTPPATPDASALDPALHKIAQQFPADLHVAMATAQILRKGPPNVPAPAQEPWPPMQVPV
jgi:hypothetical protein